MTASETPLPCPWCGKNTKHETDMCEDPLHFVTCTDSADCGVCGPLRGSEAEAIAEWNRIARRFAT